MHRTTRKDSLDSRATFLGGRNGMVVGAVAGAALFAAVTLIMELFLETSVGGVSVLAGAAAGGLAGMMIGALRARPGGGNGFERRLAPITFQGPERRNRR